MLDIPGFIVYIYVALNIKFLSVIVTDLHPYVFVRACARMCTHACTYTWEWIFECSLSVAEFPVLKDHNFIRQHSTSLGFDFEAYYQFKLTYQWQNVYIFKCLHFKHSNTNIILLSLHTLQKAALHYYSAKAQHKK